MSIPRKKQFQPVKGKLNISYRHGSSEIYAIDLTHRINGRNKKLISMSTENEGYDPSIINVIKIMLEEGVLEIHGTTVDSDK